MQTYPISGLQSTQQTQAISADSMLQIINAAKADPSGPYGKWVASHEKEVKAFLSQYRLGDQSSGAQFAAAQYPQAYSSDQISPEVQQNPNTYLNEPAVHSSARMAPQFADDSDESPSMVADDPYGDDPYGDESVDDGGDDWSASQDDPVDSGDDTTTQSSSDDGGSGRTVQTSNGGEPAESTTSSTLETPPPAPVVAREGDAFTSSAVYQRLADDQNNINALEDQLSRDPGNVQLQQAVANAKMKLQLDQQLAMEDAQIAAQHAMDALKSAILH